ncbi:unnamed protein product [Mesocestoides corti]|uniref:Proteoglycan 4-like n=2 Tax=Mesocestoides corti TaxID=53468 RepID=A0A158QT95_MESCO|nr:unnamed protein product [Mesocestoides corti]
MGGRSSKVVITPETKASAAAPEPTATITKTVMENGNTEAIPSIDEPTTEPNGDCSASAAPAEAPTDTAPAVAECHEPKSAQKVKNPISWLNKKISFKKTKTPKNVEPEKPPAESTENAEPVAEAVEEKKPELPEAPVGDVETQSAETTQVDQATSHPDPADSCSGPVVEFAPTTNGFHSQVGEEHFVEETSAPANEPVAECAAEESNTDLGLTEKLANLGIDSAQPAQTNGVADHATNVDTEVRND